MTNLDSILESRDIILPTRVHTVKAMVFPVDNVWMWELDHKGSWALRNWCFELWCWRRLLRVPWTARRSNYLILKEISPEYSLEGLMLKLKLQYFGHLMLRTDSLEKTLMLGKTEGRRGRGWQRMRCWWYHWLDTHKFEQTLGVGDGQETPVHWVTKELDNTEQLNQRVKNKEYFLLIQVNVKPWS